MNDFSKVEDINLSVETIDPTTHQHVMFPHFALKLTEAATNRTLWRKKFNVNFVVVPSDAGTITLSSGKYPYDTEISFELKLNDDFTFIQWSDGKTVLSRKEIVPNEEITYIAMCKNVNSKTIDYFDSEEEPVHISSYAKILEAGKYKFIGIAGGGKSAAQDITQSEVYDDRYATGGSSPMLSGIFDIAVSSAILITVPDIGSNTIVKVENSINVDIPHGNNAGGNYWLVTDGNEQPWTNAIYNSFTEISGWNGPHGNHGPLYFGSTDGTQPANSDFKYGCAQGKDGQNYGVRYGYVHIERFYEVTFVNYNGAVLKSKQYVLRGQDAIPPDDPTRYHMVFKGWSPAYTNITADITCVAQYETRYYYAWNQGLGGGDNEGHWSEVHRKMSYLDNLGYTNIGDPYWSEYKGSSYERLLTAVGVYGKKGEQYKNSSMQNTASPCKYYMPNMGGDEEMGNQLIWTSPT